MVVIVVKSIWFVKIVFVLYKSYRISFFSLWFFGDSNFSRMCNDEKRNILLK